MDAEAAAIPLLVAGYPVAIGVIARWPAVVRERRTWWLAAHHAAMLALIVGWFLRRPAAVPVNAAWLVASTIWFYGSRRGGRR